MLWVRRLKQIVKLNNQIYEEDLLHSQVQYISIYKWLKLIFLTIKTWYQTTSTWFSLQPDLNGTLLTQNILKWEYLHIYISSIFKLIKSYIQWDHSINTEALQSLAKAATFFPWTRCFTEGSCFKWWVFMISTIWKYNKLRSLSYIIRLTNGVWRRM